VGLASVDFIWFSKWLSDHFGKKYGAYCFVKPLKIDVRCSPKEAQGPSGNRRRLGSALLAEKGLS
jgi:hypothetical protein